MSDSEEPFTLVASNKNADKSHHPPRKNRKGKQRAVAEPKTLTTLLDEKRGLLQAKGYSQKCRGLFDEAFPAQNDTKTTLSRCRRCLCFGLGRLRDSPKSLLQLALLQEILESEELHLQFETLFVDPAFEMEDIEFLQELGFHAQREGPDLLELQVPTLLYMPHCPRSLYETLLTRNQDRQGNIVLLGNQLTSYAERELSIDKLAKIPSLQEHAPSFKSLPFPEFEDRPDAFNDMALQWLTSTGETPKSQK